MNKKILFVHHGRVIGGAPRSLKNIIIGLERNGFDNLVILFAYEDMKPFFKEDINVQIGDIYSPFLIFGRVLIGLAKLTNIKTFVYFLIELLILPIIVIKQYKTINNYNPDIVHLNSSILFATAIAAKMAKKSLVWHVREVVIGRKYNLRKKLVGWFIRKIADEVICISEVEATNLGTDKYKNVNIIYNFVDFDNFNDAKVDLANERKKYGIQEYQKVAVSLGGVSFRKGTYEVIEAAKQLSNIIFIIAGSFPRDRKYPVIIKSYFKVIHYLEDRLKNIRIKKIYSWHYAERVEFLYFKENVENLRFIGKLDNVAPLLAISDVLIFAGCTPHFPRPVYEAWALKKPVIAFCMQGITENIDHGIDGLITSKNNAKGIVESLMILFQNRKIADAMAIKGYKKSIERFDMQKNILKIVSLYEHVLRDLTNDSISDVAEL